MPESVIMIPEWLIRIPESVITIARNQRSEWAGIRIRNGIPGGHAERGRLETALREALEGLPGAWSAEISADQDGAQWYNDGSWKNDKTWEELR